MLRQKQKVESQLGTLNYINDNGEVMVAATNDSKAGVLCNFFSSVFCTENDSVFHVLSNKNCDVASETPSFNMDDIINRLKTRGQSNLTKSASRGADSPVRGHPRGSKVVPLNSWGRVSY